MNKDHYSLKTLAKYGSMREDYGDLFLLRHGQTKSNANGFWGSDGDESLTDLGRQQAVDVGHRISNLKFERIYVSPLRRCIETYNYALKGKSFPEPCIVPNLSERNVSGLKGLTTEDIFNLYKVKLSNICSSDINQIPGVESSSKFRNRTENAFGRIFMESFGKRTLIIAHGGTLWNFILAFMDIPPDRKLFKNCAFLGLKRVGNSFTPTVSINMEDGWYSSIDPEWRSKEL